MTESKHAEALRALGFTPTFGPDASVAGMPSFTSSAFMTMATDEMGGRWMAQGSHDLSSLGFKNNLEGTPPDALSTLFGNKLN